MCNKDKRRKKKYSYASEILKQLNEDYLHLLPLRKGKKERISFSSTRYYPYIIYISFSFPRHYPYIIHISFSSTRDYTSIIYIIGTILILSISSLYYAPSESLLYIYLSDIRGTILTSVFLGTVLLFLYLSVFLGTISIYSLPASFRFISSFSLL